MANLEVIALDTVTPQLKAPQAGDGYAMPRPVTVTGLDGVNSLTLDGGTQTGLTLTGVSITGTTGQFSCSAAPALLVVGQLITISGTFGGTGAITGYSSTTNYYISVTNGSTTFTLILAENAPQLSTAIGTPTGLTYSFNPAQTISTSQIWNNTNLAFTGLKFNANVTAAASSSILVDFQRSGRSVAHIKDDGAITLINPSTNRIGSIAVSAIGNATTAAGISIGGSFSNPVVHIGPSSLGTNGIFLGVTNQFAWSSAGNGTNTPDLFFTRKGAANLQLGAADAAAPVAQTIGPQSVVAGTSNTAGTNLTVRGSQGTGTGAGGNIIFQVAPVGTAGTAQNALVTQMTISSGGITSAAGTDFVSNGNFQLPGTFQIRATSNLRIAFPSDGVVTLLNWASTSFGRLQFGGTTSSFPALKVSSTILQVRLADDSAYAPLEASTLRTAIAYTVATLPAAGTAGRKAYVTDATLPTFLGALTGGGAVVCPVFDNGASWVAG